MKNLRSFFLITLLAAGTLLAQTVARFEAAPGSKVQISGTSTLHDWTVESRLIGGYMEWDAGYPLDPAVGNPPPLKNRPKVQVTIPVRQIKSGKSLMDTVMHDALKHTEHRNIEYRLTDITAKPRVTGKPLEFDTVGDLTVAGVTRPLKMPVQVQPLDADRVKVTGAANLKMSDFNVKPPAPKIALGAISTGDDIKISFEWLVKSRPATTDAAEK